MPPPPAVDPAEPLPPPAPLAPASTMSDGLPDSVPVHAPNARHTTNTQLRNRAITVPIRPFVRALLHDAPSRARPYGLNDARQRKELEVELYDLAAVLFQLRNFQ